jgi:pyruvate formate lyase activating enzyme
MDVKSSLNAGQYAKAMGVPGGAAIFKNINESIDLLLHSGIEYEFRTTVVPGLAGPGDLMDIALRIKGANAYYLQQFRPGKTLDPKMRTVSPYFTEVLQEVRNKILQQNLVATCEVRA